MASISYDPSVHGFNGPVNVSYSNFVYNQTGNLFTALNELGIPIASDPNSGDVAGASFMPLNIDPINQTRCSARTAYYKPYTARPNLWVSTGQHVTQILLEGSTQDATSSQPIAGDFSVGQGNTSNSGTLFGNMSSMPMMTGRVTIPRAIPRLRTSWEKTKRWLGIQSRQTTVSSNNITSVRAVGVQASRPQPEYVLLFNIRLVREQCTKSKNQRHSNS